MKHLIRILLLLLILLVLGTPAFSAPNEAETFYFPLIAKSEVPILPGECWIVDGREVCTDAE